MAADRRESEPVREFRLEGGGLFIVGGLIVAGLAGAFYVGRWYERSVRPAGPAAMLEQTDPLGNVVHPDQATDVDASANFFDSVQGDEKQAEPERETQRAEPAAHEQPPADAAVVESAGGPWFVQVHAGRDRRAVEELKRQLESAGYPVRLLSEREGQGALYKVRVGGFQSEAEARESRSGLVAAGYAGAWVPPLEN